MAENIVVDWSFDDQLQALVELKKFRDDIIWLRSIYIDMFLLICDIGERND